MSTSIDAAGRLVIPKTIRDAAGLRPGVPLLIRCRDARVEIEPAPLAVRIEQRGRVAVAVPEQPVPAVDAEQIEELRREVRTQRAD